MGYEAADLLLVVRDLAERYTGRASTSVSYETARQLMEAVLYCIGEAGKAENATAHSREVAGGERLTAQEAYRRGYGLVIRRAEEAQTLYNKLILSFNGYESRVYRRTVTRNIPGFFRRYDPRFNPQQDFMGLDYPVFAPLGKRPGIDKVYRYLACISAEQRFLGSMSPDLIRAALTACCPDYRELPVNIGEIVLRKLLVNLLLGISLEETALRPDRYEALAAEVNASSGEGLAQRLRELTAGLAGRYFPGEEALARYLYFYIPGIRAALANGAKHGCMQRIV